MVYRTLLFDVDGVMLSEERYFDATALTVIELWNRSCYLGLSAQPLDSIQDNPTETYIRNARQYVFADDRALFAMKSKGINANWDMVYLLFAFALGRLLDETATVTISKYQPSEDMAEYLCRVGHVLQSREGHRNLPDFQKFVCLAESASDKADLMNKVNEKLRRLVSANEEKIFFQKLWELGCQVFQTWYLGQQSDSPLSHEKRGFLHDEEAIVDIERFRALLIHLQSSGIALGIATGRPDVETRVPLSHLGLLSLFDKKRISTASDVLHTERQYPEFAPLSKPHPFSYLRSLLATEDVEQVLHTSLPLSDHIARQVLIVGDSVADAICAQKIGCDFAAVLTGPSGEAARAEFEALGANYIFKDVLELFSLFAK
ncbi:Phosphoglycolate phosphatase, HAD superfamily [Alicyclobacillus tolerans]|uniref:Phosphoglycolate phosphatase, HAD superfamily n=1 Tax=Alicyclobacillus tolerans TaxID=90970 RepID=A0A1M6NF67_9BACL|nr:Phosphoglycolate phosphatase, HAD superfamily [Alicyclobacillus montanus]